MPFFIFRWFFHVADEPDEGIVEEVGEGKREGSQSPTSSACQDNQAEKASQPEHSNLSERRNDSQMNMKGEHFGISADCTGLPDELEFQSCENRPAVRVRTKSIVPFGKIYGPFKGILKPTVESQESAWEVRLLLFLLQNSFCVLSRYPVSHPIFLNPFSFRFVVCLWMQPLIMLLCFVEWSTCSCCHVHNWSYSIILECLHFFWQIHVQTSKALYPFHVHMPLQVPANLLHFVFSSMGIGVYLHFITKN